MIEIRDLFSGQFYCINLQSICYFSKEKNNMGTNCYYVVLNDTTKIFMTHKKWNKVRKSLEKSKI